MGEFFAVVGGIVAVMTALLSMLLLLYSHRRAIEPVEEQWRLLDSGDGTWCVLRHEVISELGIDEHTIYSGYQRDEAVAVANWLNNREDLRSLDRVLFDVEEERKRAAAAREDRRLHGGDPIYALGHSDPIDYAEPLPVVTPLITQQYFQKMLDLHRDGHLSKKRMREEIDRHHADVWTEHDLRKSLMDLVRAISHDGWTVEAREQYQFLRERSVQLNLKHVFMSYLDTYSTVFDSPSQGIPTKKELR